MAVLTTIPIVGTRKDPPMATQYVPGLIEPLVPLPLKRCAHREKPDFRLVKDETGHVVSVKHFDMEAWEPRIIPVYQGTNEELFVLQSQGEYLAAQDRLRRECLTFSEINAIVYDTIKLALEMRAALNLPPNGVPTIDPENYRTVFQAVADGYRIQEECGRKYLQYHTITLDGGTTKVPVLQYGNEKRSERMVRAADAEFLIRQEVRKALEYSTVGAVTEAASVTRRLVHNWIAKGILHGATCDHTTYIPNQEVAELLQKRSAAKAQLEKQRQQSALVGYIETLERAGMDCTHPYLNTGTPGNRQFTYESFDDDGTPITRVCKLYQGGLNKLFLTKEDADFIIAREDALEKWFSIPQLATMLGMDYSGLTRRIAIGERAVLTLPEGYKHDFKHITLRGTRLLHPGDVLDLLSLVEKVGKDCVALESIDGAALSLASHVDEKTGVIRLSESMINLDLDKGAAAIEVENESAASEMISGMRRKGATIQLMVDNYGLAIPFVKVGKTILIRTDDAELVMNYISFSRGNSRSDRLFESILKRAVTGEKLSEIDLATMWVARFFYITTPSQSACGQTAWYKTFDRFDLPGKNNTDENRLRRLLLSIYEKGFAERHTAPAAAEGELKSSGDAQDA